MNFDKIYYFFRKSSEVFDKKIPKDKLTESRFHYKKGSKELAVICPPWVGRYRYNIFLRRSLLKKDISVLEYRFPREALSINPEYTKYHFENISERVIKDIKKLKKKHKFEKVRIIGISTGGMIASICANNSEDIDELFSIPTASCLAEALWEGIATKHLRKAFEEQGITLKDLKKHWKTLAPENNLNNLKGKKISFLLTQTDKLIPFSSGEKLLKKMKSSGVEFNSKIQKNSGHYFMILRFYLNPKKFLFNEG